MTTMTAAEFAKQMNDNSRAWLAANPDGWVGLMSEDEAQQFYDLIGKGDY